MGDNNISLIDNKDLDQSQTKEKQDLVCFVENVQCHICDFTTDSKYALNKHKRKHVKNEGFLCPTCPKVFSRHCSLNEHIKVHGRELTGRKFTNEEKMEAIELSKSLGILDVSKKYKVTEQTIKYWMKLVTSPLYCSQCNYAIYSKSRLKNHEENCQIKSNLFTCDICQDVFKRTLSLEKHQHKVHGGNAPKPGRFVCSDCLKSYSKKITLNNHKRLCSGPNADGLLEEETYLTAQVEGIGNTQKPVKEKREHACSDCPKSYRNKYNFNNHKKVCAGSHAVSFSIADKGFVDEVVSYAGKNSVLLAARKYKIPEVTVKEWLQRLTPESCIGCKKTFFTKSALFKHNKRHHSDNNAFLARKVLRQKIIDYTINHTIEEAEKAFSMSEQTIMKWLKKESDLKVNHKEMNSSCSLKQMYESRHGELQIKIEPEKVIKGKVKNMFTCDQCEFVSTRKWGVTKHKKRKHTFKANRLKDNCVTKNKYFLSHPIKKGKLKIKEDYQDQAKDKERDFTNSEERLENIDSKHLSDTLNDFNKENGIECKSPLKEDVAAKNESPSITNEDQEKSLSGNTILNEDNILKKEFYNDKYEATILADTFVAKDVGGDYKQVTVKVDHQDVADEKADHKSNICNESLISSASSLIQYEDSSSTGFFVSAKLNAEIKSFNKFWLENTDNQKEKKNKPSVKVNICSICDKAFKINSEMKRHVLRTHSETKNISCGQCDFRTKRNDTLLSHMKTKHDKECETYLCAPCGRVFKVKGEMNRHMKKIHEPVKDPLCCLHCKRIFTRVHTRVKHENVCLQTSKEKCFMCHLCDSSFYKERKLTHHIQRHEGTTKVKCHLCEKTFATDKSRKQHLNIIHEECKTNFLCSTCSKSFTRSTSLKAHRKFVHEKQRPVICDTCEMVFKDNRDKDKHKLVCMG